MSSTPHLVVALPPRTMSAGPSHSFLHPNNMTIEQFIQQAQLQLGRNDFTQPMKIFEQHWVRTVQDLRLLHLESMLSTLGLPLRFVVWLESEIWKMKEGPPEQEPHVIFPPIQLTLNINQQQTNNASSSSSFSSSSSYSSSSSSSSSTTAAATSAASSPSLLEAPSSSLPYADRIAYFPHTHDFDTQGIIYYLGSKNYTDAYHNPLTFSTPCIRVKSSELSKESGPLSQLLERNHAKIITMPHQSAYISVQFTFLKICPLYYTLKHSSFDHSYLRDWELQGSPDGESWSTLRHHTNDLNLNGKNSTCTWKIEDIHKKIKAANAKSSDHTLSPLSLLNCSSCFYSHFRVVLRGVNSSNTLMLACAGVELYGYVLFDEQWSKLNKFKRDSNNCVSEKDVSSLPLFSSFHPIYTLPTQLMFDNSTLDEEEEDHEVVKPQRLLDAKTVEGTKREGISRSDSVSSALASLHISHSSSPAQSHIFTYRGRDFGGDGIIHALATNNSTSSFVNPMTANRLFITSSSLMEDSVSLDAVVDRDCVRCVTKAIPYSWIRVDMLDKTVHLTAYTLRHYNSWDTECLRNWKLESSVDGNTWQLLREHKNDEHLIGKGATYTWLIEEPYLSAQLPARYLRIFQTGPNSNNHYFLPCSGLELYGKVLKSDGITPYDFQAAHPPLKHSTSYNSIPSQAQQSSNVITLTHYTHDFDKNGIIYYLATQGLTGPWVNPVSTGALQVYSSSLAEDSEHLSAMVGDKVVRCVTLSEPDQWMCVDFLQRLVQPTAYTLRHYSSWDTECLRNWRFQGTVDSNPNTLNWVTIREHREDESLDGKGATATWQVQTDQWFRMFRIYQFDRNSSRHHYLACSGFEIYGSFKPSNAAHAPLLHSASSSSLSRAHSALPSPAAAVELDTWNAVSKGVFMAVLHGYTTVRNSGSQDKWQVAKSNKSYDFGIHAVSLKILSDPITSNNWKFIIGVIPTAFDCQGSKQWLGANNSWGYIGGTGGKCHNTGASVEYAAKYGLGDIITIVMNFVNKTLTFWKNDKCQGVAFTNLTGPVHVAASLTATDAQIQFVRVPDAISEQLASPVPSSVPSQLAPASSSSSSSSASQFSYPLAPLGFDPLHKSTFLILDPSLAQLSKHGPTAPNSCVRNEGSNDKWQCIRSEKVFRKEDGNIQSFDVEVLRNPPTNNSWQMIVGVVPSSFTFNSNKQWIGAAESYGYIAGSGGKCHNEPKTIPYGASFGAVGDVVTVVLDFAAKTIEFRKNGKSQGIAFNNLVSPVYAAVSVTATGAALKLIIHK